MVDGRTLRETLELQSAVLAERGMDVRALTVLEPATEADVDAVEDALGLVLPGSLRTTFTHLSAKVE